MSEDRRMIYPYTLTAKVVKFPFKFYYEKNPRFRYTLWSMVICFPLFYKIQKLSFAEGNVQKYYDFLKKEREEVEEHKKHLL